MPEGVRALVAAYSKPHGFLAAVHDEVIEVSAPVSTAATLYEKVRNTLDYQEEHLLRRNAIARFFQRHMGGAALAPLAPLAPELLRELVWAKYLPNKAVPTHLADRLAAVTAKYEALFQAAAHAGQHRERVTRWILDALATEVEYTIAPPVHDEALASYMYQEMRARTEWDPGLKASDDEKDLRTYIAVHRTLLKSNMSTLRYKVLSLYFPEWAGASTPECIARVAGSMTHTADMVDAQINHPLTERLARLMRRRAGIFRVLGDVLGEDPAHFGALLDEPDALDREVASALRERTDHFRTRLRRTVVRTVVFLFITKMLLALLLELPYDYIVLEEKAPLYPLVINILFPPFFLALLSLTVTIPRQKNAEDYQSAVRALVLGAEHEALNLRLKREARSAWWTVFNVLYGLTFLVVYGLIGVLLHNIGFHALSIVLFLFFLSIVTFFGIRIRNSAKDIVALDSRSGIVGTMFDVFMLPIVRAGSWLSVKVAKINVFIFFFDVIVEAPFKVAIRFVESWLAFVREKKEEI